jgi:hypothetical protein
LLFFIVWFFKKWILKGGFENFRPIVREEKKHSWEKKSKKEVEEKRKQINPIEMRILSKESWSNQQILGDFIKKKLKNQERKRVKIVKYQSMNTYLGRGYGA